MNARQLITSKPLNPKVVLGVGLGVMLLGMALYKTGFFTLGWSALSAHGPPQIKPPRA